MTRKRTDKRAKQAVPDEILAEGSGPNEVVEAVAQALADAAASQGLGPSSTSATTGTSETSETSETSDWTAVKTPGRPVRADGTGAQNAAENAADNAIQARLSPRHASQSVRVLASG